ncbi:hypothetical protein Riv7116_0150 [Rivularia sp. PCC 7116]|uniref:hypothetical protein n=1 Tax=Rivularia sp. PCC 7116 TaxID=373994 RepID=UPI00029ED525|nr:hypothetical protein [Rivularia sp. PCC 7116]AFY52759.1 hypothetical protein Riv7116_0150 [Rivularia sp. PCC 7116]
MSETIVFTLFQVIWQDLVENVAYDSTKQNWQALQVVIDEIKGNKQIGEDLAVALEKSFYSSDKIIAEKCRDELIKKSTYTQYRGAKIYNPPDNDTGIKKLENKIRLLEKQLKQFDKKLFAKKSFINPSDLEQLVKELSQSGHEASEKVKQNANNQFLQEAEKDCYVNIYKSAITDENNGLRKLMFNSFLIVIEPNEQLNRIFNAKTYLILNKIREQVK